MEEFTWNKRRNILSSESGGKEVRKVAATGSKERGKAGGGKSGIERVSVYQP